MQDRLPWNECFLATAGLSIPALFTRGTSLRGRPTLSPGDKVGPGIPGVCTGGGDTPISESARRFSILRSGVSLNLLRSHKEGQKKAWPQPCSIRLAHSRATCFNAVAFLRFPHKMIGRITGLGKRV